MLGRILLTGTIATTLSACAILAPMEGQSTREGYFAPKSLSQQDPYWQRFYALEQQIAQLQASNAKLQQQIAPADGVYTAPAPQAQVAVSDPAQSTVPDSTREETTTVNGVLARVREQADRAIAAIDQAIASLATASEVTAPESHATVQVNIPDIQGNLVRNDEGEVVKHTTYSEATKARYNYSVVYVYPEPKPWNEMWDKLESANEVDKWRGFNPGHTRYFIYVGAYYNQMDAQQRQDALLSLVGERPDLRERVQNNALAAK